MGRVFIIWACFASYSVFAEDAFPHGAADLVRNRVARPVGGEITAGATTKTARLPLPLPTAEMKATRAGRVFVRDTSQPKLGEDAWRDQMGAIWGDVVKNDDGSLQVTTHEKAAAYCKKIGADLPSTADFQRLRKYMAFDREGEYTAQVLPNLNKGPLWSSHRYQYGPVVQSIRSALGTYSNSDHYTFTTAGELKPATGDQLLPFRCVVHPALGSPPQAEPRLDWRLSPEWTNDSKTKKDFKYKYKLLTVEHPGPEERSDSFYLVYFADGTLKAYPIDKQYNQTWVTVSEDYSLKVGDPKDPVLTIPAEIATAGLSE